MHSFHPSRGKILFEVFCALGMAASCAVAWMQTGASALLGAAAVAALYGLGHLFALRQPKRAGVVEPQRVEFDTELEHDLPDLQSELVTPSAEDQPPAADQSFEEAEIAQPAAPRTTGNRRPKAPRKRSSRSTSAPKAAPVTDLAPLESAPEPVVAEEEPPIHLAPLFEPAPFVRQQRAAFGRKAG
jgi:hypothetical protein